MLTYSRPSSAANRSVTDPGDTTPVGAPGQLRFEINAAAPDDTIVIPAGTITLTGAAGEDANAGATPTFSIFALGTGPIPFDAATNRIFVRFTDQGGVTRGATSVAVRTL